MDTPQNQTPPADADERLKKWMAGKTDDDLKKMFAQEWYTQGNNTLKQGESSEKKSRG